MKSIIIICLFGVAAVAYAKPKENYTDRYDNIDIDQILSSDKLLTIYIKCLLDQGPCPPEAKELKSRIKEALEQNCAKCTEAQRAGANRVIAYLINKKHEIWEQLKAKYDSTGKYSAKYENDLRELKA